MNPNGAPCSIASQSIPVEPCSKSLGRYERENASSRLRLRRPKSIRLKSTTPPSQLRQLLLSSVNHTTKSTTTSKIPRNLYQGERTSEKQASYITSHPSKAPRSQRTSKPSRILSLSHLQKCHSSTYLRTRHPRNLSLWPAKPSDKGAKYCSRSCSDSERQAHRSSRPSTLNPRPSKLYPQREPLSVFQPSAQLP